MLDVYMNKSIYRKLKYNELSANLRRKTFQFICLRVFAVNSVREMKFYNSGNNTQSG